MDIVRFIENLAPEFNELAASHKAVRFAEECLFAKQILEGNNYLRDIAIKNPESLKSAILNVAAAGLTLNPVHKKAYLVPRKGVVCLDVSYRGLINLAHEGGAISWIQCQLVYKNDKFEMQGINQPPKHDFQPFLDRGELVGGYMITKLKNSDYLTHLMKADRIYDIRSRSDSFKSGKNSPWLTDFDEMAKKTIVKQGTKMLPESDLGMRFAVAVEAENTANGIDFEAVEEIAPEDMPGAVAERKEEALNKLKALLARATEGKTNDEKGRYLYQMCNVKSFNSLKEKSVDYIDGLCVKIEKDINKPKSAGDIKFTLDGNE